MKYFTREWYKLMQYAGIVSSLNVDAKANFYNENYFNDLYIQKEFEFISKQININIHLRQAYNDKEFREYFLKSYHGPIIYYKNIIPINILDKVADIRVFALGVVSQEVYDLLYERKVLYDQIDNEYENYFNSISSKINGTNLEVLNNLHDAIIKESETSNQDLKLKIDSSNSFADVKEIIIKNYLCNPENFLLKNLWWLYNEFYFLDNRIKIDVLLANEKNELFEISIIFDNVLIKA